MDANESTITLDPLKKKYRNVCFTLNKFDGTAQEWFDRLDKSWIRYIVCQHERKSHDHIQGYVELKDQMTGKRIIECLGPAHIEERKFTQQAAVMYCCKEETRVDGPFEFGVPKRAGARTDIADVKALIKNGASFEEIYEFTDSYQALKMAQIGMNIREKSVKRNWVPEVVWYYGPTGLGKTQDAIKNTNDAWISGETLQWWSFYEGQRHIILDDLNADSCKLNTLLRICDSTPYAVPVKGGCKQLLAEQIYITSRMDPLTCFKDAPGDKRALMRRIALIMRYGVGKDGKTEKCYEWMLPDSDVFETHYNRYVDKIFNSVSHSQRLPSNTSDKK